jgi:hypothetical protein
MPSNGRSRTSGRWVADAGGTANLYGVSSGGALVLQTAAAGLAIDRLAVYEDGHVPTDRFAQIRQPSLVVTGGRDDLFERAADAIAASPPGGTSAP